MGEPYHNAEKRLSKRKARIKEYGALMPPFHFGGDFVIILDGIDHEPEEIGDEDHQTERT